MTGTLTLSPHTRKAILFPILSFFHFSPFYLSFVIVFSSLQPIFHLLNGLLIHIGALIRSSLYCVSPHATPPWHSLLSPSLSSRPFRHPLPPSRTSSLSLFFFSLDTFLLSTRGALFLSRSASHITQGRRFKVPSSFGSTAFFYFSLRPLPHLPHPSSIFYSHLFTLPSAHHYLFTPTAVPCKLSLDFYPSPRFSLCIHS